MAIGFSVEFIALLFGGVSVLVIEFGSFGAEQLKTKNNPTLKTIDKLSNEFFILIFLASV